MANFVSSITLQFRDLFSGGMARASDSVTALQGSLNSINPGGLTELASAKITIPTPEIAQPVIPSPETPTIAIPAPDIPQPEISAPDIPMITIPTPDIPQPEIPIPDNPPIDIPVPAIPQPAIPAPDTSLFRQGLDEIQAGLDKLAENNALNTLATQLSVMSMAVGPIQQSLNSAMDQPSKLAATYESSMKNIQAITGNSAQEMAILNQQLLNIGKNALAGPQGAADAMNDIAGGVDNAASHLGILQGAVLLAEAGQADLGVAANGLVSIMNAYSLASGDAASATANAVTVSDVLTQTVGQGVGSMEQFISAFSQVSGVSASVGVGFDEVGAALAFITTQGPSASEAATQLKAAETALLNPNETLAKALQSVGIASGSAMLAEYGLVESLNIVKQSVGGSQDAMAKALGSTMALQGATALMGDGYTDFAAKFGAALATSVTAEAAAVQNQSYEAKMARMESATQSLQLQVGDNINAIKGFFADMGATFLTGVVSPLMSSPLGGVFQGVAAGVGVVGQQLLSVGGSALTAAVQFTTLAANIKNAGGYAKIFHGTMQILQTPFKSVGGLVSGFITRLLGIGAAGATAAGGTTAVGVATGASAAPIGAATVATGGFSLALNSVIWPALAVVAGIAAIAAGAYMLVKHWDTVSAFFVGLWQTITGAFAAAWDWMRNLFGIMPTWIGAFLQSLWSSVTGAFAPVVAWFGSVWNAITASFQIAWHSAATFFIGLWDGLTNIVAQVVDWFMSAWNTVVLGFTNLWNNVAQFFSNLWNGMTATVANTAAWFSGIWGTVTAPFAAAFIWIGNLFASIWDGIQGVVQRFVTWLSPVVDAIIAPFRAVGDVIGGIINTVGGWLGQAVDAGNAAVANRRPELAQGAAPQTITATTTPPSLAATIPAAPVSSVSVAAPVTRAAVVEGPTLATSAVTTPDLGSAIIAPPVVPSAAPVVMPELPTVTTQSPMATATTTAPSAGNILALEHFGAAQRKGIAAEDISYAASSAFESAGGLSQAMTAFDMPTAAQAPTWEIPAIEEQTRERFAAAMPQPANVQPAPARNEAREAAPRQNVFNIREINCNADELRTIIDFVHQLELLTTTPEAELV